MGTIWLDQTHAAMEIDLPLTVKKHVVMQFKVDQITDVSVPLSSLAQSSTGFTLKSTNKFAKHPLPTLRLLTVIPSSTETSLPLRRVTTWMLRTYSVIIPFNQFRTHKAPIHYFQQNLFHELA